MEHIRFYEVNCEYVNFLSQFEPLLFHNKASNQTNERKYIGVVLCVNGFQYFAPLSSHKPKHDRMQNGIDFIKIKQYAVINLNNMFPVPKTEYKNVDFSKVSDYKYKSLLLSEYRYIKAIEKKIMTNAKIVYKHKTNTANKTSLSQRCNDFLILEKACMDYISKNKQP